MKGTWHNNIISQKLNMQYPKDFSICDIDGMIRCGYHVQRKVVNRLIIYESKRIMEHYALTIGKPMQLISLRMLKRIIDWRQADKNSGVYLIVHEEEKAYEKLDSLAIYDIDDIYHPIREELSFDDFYRWIKAEYHIFDQSTGELIKG